MFEFVKGKPIKIIDEIPAENPEQSIINKLFSDKELEKNAIAENPKEMAERNKIINSINDAENGEDSETKEETENDAKDVKNPDAKEDTKIEDPVIKDIEESIGSKDGLEELIEEHPEKKDLWDKLRNALDVLNNPNATAVEIRSAQGTLNSIKGQILEIAAKDALSKAGLDVENTQQTVKGENGDTKPDIIAHNNTDKPIEVLGVVVQPGESLFVECKCGNSGYLKNELNNHIPNQLSGHEGKSVLLTTSDIKNTTSGLAENVCNKYDTKLAPCNINVGQVDNTIKEVFGK